MKAIYAAPPRGSVPLALRPVTDVMSAPVVSVPAVMLLGDALRAMVRLRHRHLLVVDDAGRCIGVLVDRAIAAAWAKDPASLSARPVRSALRTPPAMVGTRAKVLDVSRLMRAGGVDAVVVADEDGRPVGIVTSTDLVALLAR